MRILVAYDGSDPAKRALERAADPRRRRARDHACSASCPVLVGARGGGIDPTSDVADHRRMLDEAAELLAERDIHAQGPRGRRPSRGGDRDRRREGGLRARRRSAPTGTACCTAARLDDEPRRRARTLRRAGRALTHRAPPTSLARPGVRKWSNLGQRRRRPAVATVSRGMRAQRGTSDGRRPVTPGRRPSRLPRRPGSPRCSRSDRHSVKHANVAASGWIRPRPRRRFAHAIFEPSRRSSSTSCRGPRTSRASCGRTRSTSGSTARSSSTSTTRATPILSGTRS